MQPNPYQSPSHPMPPPLPKRRSFGARMVRLGVFLLGLGLVTGVACFAAGFVLVNMDVKEPPYWLMAVSFTAMALLPIGTGLALVGGAIWLLTKMLKT